MTHRVTPELVAALWHPTEVALCAHGDRVAWSAEPYGREGEHPESGIWVASIAHPGAARRWTHGGADEHPRWSPDGAALAFVSDRHERGTGGVYVLRVDGGEARPLVVRQRSVADLAWSPDGRSLAFLAPSEPDDEDSRGDEQRDDPHVHGERWQHHHLYRVDVDSGVVTCLHDDDRHLTELAWSPNGSAVAVLARTTPGLDDSARAEVWVVPSSADRDSARRVVTAPWAHGLVWSGDGGLLAYAGPHEPHPVSAHTVWAVPAAGGEARVVGPGPDEPCCGVAAGAVSGERRLLVKVLEGLDTRIEWCDPANGEREVLWSSDVEVDAFDVACTGRGPDLVAVCARPGDGPEVWGGSPTDLRPLSPHTAKLASVALGRVEDFVFTGADGTALDGVLILPPRATAEPGPTVVLLRGGPYGRSGRWLHLHPLDWGQLLATAGCTVLLPNYRGGAGRGHTFATAARGAMGSIEWDDVLAAVDAVVERGIADPDRLGIGGWSQGGFLSAWAVTQTDRFAAAVMGAGVSDWGMLTMTTDVPTFEARLGGDRPWDGPGPHQADRGSPISYAGARRTPLLILHGQEDARVPVSQAVGFHRALRDQDAPVELVTYPREPHSIRERRHQEDLMRRVRDWYVRWLRLDP